MAISSLPQLKNALGISDQTEDGQLSRWLLEADQIVKNFCKRDLEETTYTEYYMGNNSRYLVLNHRPVQSITSVHQDSDAYFGQADNAFESADALTEGEEYVLIRDNNTSASEKSKRAMLLKLKGVWPAAEKSTDGLLSQHLAGAAGNIKVVYVAGYDTIPVDLESAVHQIVAVMRQSSGHGGPLQSESLDYYSYQLASADPQGRHPLSHPKQILSRYKEAAI